MKVTHALECDISRPPTGLKGKKGMGMGKGKGKYFLRALAFSWWMGFVVDVTKGSAGDSYMNVCPRLNGQRFRMFTPH